MPVVTDYTALLSGNYWNGIEVPSVSSSAGNPIIVTFSFPTTLPAYDDTLPGFTADTLASFTAFSANEQAQALAALGEWSAASGIIFVQVAPGQGDINFTNVDLNTSSYSGAGGIGFYPFGNWNSFSYPYFTDDLTSSGDVFMNTQYQNADGTVDYGTLLHEIGHAIGLKHPTEVVVDSAANPPVEHNEVLSSDDPTRTIMATVGDESTPDQHLKPLDQDAAAFLYGAAGTGAVVTSSTSGSNSVSNWTWDAITQTLTQTAVSVSEVIHGTSVDDVIIGSSGADTLLGLAGNDSISGGDDNDYLYGGSGNNTLAGGQGNDNYYVDSATDQVVEESTQGFDSVYATVSFTLPDNFEYLQVNGSGLTATGNNQGDEIFGDGVAATHLIGGTAADYIVGGAGNDTIAGGGSTDLMYGQGGDDIFVFTSPSDAPIGLGGTTEIGDFTHNADKIDFSAITASNGDSLFFTNTGTFTGAPGDVTATTSGTFTVVSVDLNGDDVPDMEILLGGSPTLTSSDFIFSPLCFLAGTRIATPGGERLIETLAPGDLVCTASGATRHIVWIGQGSHLATPNRRTAATPVLVAKGALGHNLPHRDLRLTKAHALFLDGMLVPVEFLVNHRSIRWDDHTRKIELFHVELESHDVLLANGAPAESYRDDGNRWLFQNANSGWDLPPQEPCAPVVTDGPALDALWQRLLDLAGPRPGWVLTDEPDLHLLVDGQRIDPSDRYGQAYRFHVDGPASTIRLCSRAACPDELGLGRDPRMLGVAVERIAVWQDEASHVVEATDARLQHGFHAFEAGGAARWTDGDALLPDDLRTAFTGRFELVVRLSGRTLYPVLTEAAREAA